jgi:hypothetical protein
MEISPPTDDHHRPSLRPARREDRTAAMPALMRVHPAVFARLRELRETEIVNGYPLMFLGMELEADDGLPLDCLEFAD